MNRLDSLTGLRFFAALYVVLHHWATVVDFGPVDRVADLGYVGVSFFFVLSGFVLTWSRRAEDRPLAFYRRRFARVVPLHVLFILPGVLYAVVGILDVTPASVVLSALLLQAWTTREDVVFGSLNGPSWSLSDEVFFYAVFPALILLLAGRSRMTLRLLVPATVAGMAAVFALAWWASGGAGVMEWRGYFLPPFRLGEFVLGIVLALLLRRGAIRFPSLTVSIVATAIAVTAVAAVDPQANRVVVGLVLLPFWALVIGSAAQLDRDLRPSALRHPALVKLGVWSFALYLAHMPLLAGLLELRPGGFDGSLPVAAASTVFFVALAIAVAALAHVLVEAPMERRLRGTPRPSAVMAADADTPLGVEPTAVRP